MIFAARDENTLIISSASTFEEYEVFKAQVLADETLDTKLASRVMLFTDDRVKSFQIPPVLVEFADEAALTAFTSNGNVSILNADAARSAQRDMMEEIQEQVAAEADDRRTLEEIHGLENDDPWERFTNDEAREASKKLSDKMKELRKTGGVTGDSFGGKVKKGLNVHEVNATVDKEGKVEVDSINASKSTMGTYKLEGERQELEKAFAALQIPLNRIEELADGSGVEVMLHKHQVKLVTDVLDKEGVTYTLTKLDVNDAPDLAPMGTYWQLEVKDKRVSETDDLLKDVVVNDKPYAPVYKDDIEDGCILFFERETEAKGYQAALGVHGIVSHIKAVNQKAQAIVQGNMPAGVKVVDMNAGPPPVTDPRPWNARAKEWPKKGKKKIEEAIGSIKQEEFIFAARQIERERAVLVWFAPLTYYAEHKKLYKDGPLFLEKLLERVDFGRAEKVEEYLYRFRNADQHLLTAQLAQVGFKGNWLFQFSINSQEDDDEL